MYPELQSPLSPQDQVMSEPPEMSKPAVSTNITKPSLENLRHLNNDVQPEKTISDTLKNNIDSKDEVNKKRTSLKIENACDNIGGIVVDGRDTDGNGSFNSSSDGLDDFKSSTKNTHLSKQRMDNNTGSLKSDIFSDCDNHKCDIDIDNNNKNNINACLSLRNNDNDVDDNDNNDDDDDDDEGDYNDLDNGNTTDSTRKRDSITSRESSEEYFICEQLKNLQNCSMLKDGDTTNNMGPLELLSPNEVPLGRRYAEIAHFKGNNMR